LGWRLQRHIKVEERRASSRYDGPKKSVIDKEQFGRSELQGGSWGLGGRGTRDVEMEVGSKNSTAREQRSSVNGHLVLGKK